MEISNNFVLSFSTMIENDEIKKSRISIKLFVLFALFFKKSRCYYSEFVLYFNNLLK